MSRPKRNMVWIMIIHSLALYSSLITAEAAVAAAEAPEAAGDIANECKDDFQKVISCLDFSSGKTAAPTKQCCSSVEDIKEDDAKCLCYIIQQVHNNGESVKAFGIQEAKLLQLPTACHLKNASVSDCPKYLGLSPSSPDAAIFTNATGSSTTGGKTTPPMSTTDGSDSIMHGPTILLSSTVSIALAFFLYALSGCSF